MEKTTRLSNEMPNSITAERTRLTNEVLEDVRVASGRGSKKSLWLISNALSSKLIRPSGTYIGRFRHSRHDAVCLTKPYAGAPLRQRDFCCTSRFLLLLVERMKLTTVDELLFAAVELV